VTALLKGIDRYNPENLKKLERYVQVQCQENVYDLEANLAVLKLYQFNPMFFPDVRYVADSPEGSDESSTHRFHALQVSHRRSTISRRR